MSTKSGRFKLMKDRTEAELDQCILNAEQIGANVKLALALTVNPFWEFCAGIDAYFEKRARKAVRDAENARIERLAHERSYEGDPKEWVKDRT